MTTLRRFRWHAALSVLVAALVAAVPMPGTCGIRDCLNCFDTCQLRYAECIGGATTPLSQSNCLRASIACRLKCETTMCTP
jgi:hypothetical protein